MRSPITPCGRELSVDRGCGADGDGHRSTRPSPAWPLWLLRLEAATVYGASGLSKLVDGDWFGGTVTWQRVVRVQDRLVASPLPDWAITVLTNRSFHTFAAKVIVGTELFIAFGLWWRSTRYAAVWIAVCFHIAIQVSASVEVFSYLGIAALVIWAVPSTRDRVLVVDPASAVAPTARRRRPVTRLAGPLPRRARSAWIGGAGHRSRRHAHRRWAGRRVRVEPVAPDGVVRAAGADAAVGSPGAHARRPVMAIGHGG